MNNEEEGIEEITIHDFVAPDLTKQVQQISTELFEVCKMVGYEAAYDEGSVMEHYMCSFLAANAAIALCMKMSEEEGLARMRFRDWLLRRPPKPRASD